MERICRANEVLSDFWKGLYQITDTTKMAADAGGRVFICPCLKTRTVNDLRIQMQNTCSTIWRLLKFRYKIMKSFNSSHAQTHFSNPISRLARGVYSSND